MSGLVTVLGRNDKLLGKPGLCLREDQHHKIIVCCHNKLPLTYLIGDVVFGVAYNEHLPVTTTRYLSIHRDSF